VARVGSSECANSSIVYRVNMRRDMIANSVAFSACGDLEFGGEFPVEKAPVLSFDTDIILCDVVPVSASF